MIVNLRLGWCAYSQSRYLVLQPMKTDVNEFEEVNIASYSIA